MPHKLMISAKVKPPKEYRKLLSPIEVVAFAINNVELTIRNIGKETFPGGKISEGKILIEFFIGMSTVTVSTKVTPRLPAIPPNETLSRDFKWSPYCPGLWRISMKIISKDNTPIQYYQRRKGTPKEKEWVYALYAVDPHQLDLTLLLEEYVRPQKETKRL